jgi:SAM-dependent methyltransferase
MASRFVARLDARWYPGEGRTWDNARYRTYLLERLTPASRVLDIGAGRGRIPEMNLRGQVREIVGIDPDPCVLQNPYLDQSIHHPDVLAPLPFPDGSFDAVVTSNVLEHVESPVPFFREVRRVLRPGGLFISKTPNRGHYVAVIAAMTPHAFHEWVNARRGRAAADTYPTYYRANSMGRLRALASETGFEAVDLGTWEGPPNYLRILPPVYPLGILYERVVNASPALAPFRAVLVSTLRAVPA